MKVSIECDDGTEPKHGLGYDFSKESDDMVRLHMSEAAEKLIEHRRRHEAVPPAVEVRAAIDVAPGRPIML